MSLGSGNRRARSHQAMTVEGQGAAGRWQLKGKEPGNSVREGAAR